MDQNKKSKFIIKTSDLNANVETFKKYQSSFINGVNNTAQSTRPRIVGQMSELVPEFLKYSIDNNIEISIESWKVWHTKRMPNSLEKAYNKTWELFQKQKNAIDSLNKEDIKRWTEDLLYYKTLEGLLIESKIFEHLKKDYPMLSFKKSTPSEESKNIDILVNNEVMFQVKPATFYKTTSVLKIYEQIQSHNINLIIYKKTKDNNIEVFFDKSKMPNQKYK